MASTSLFLTVTIAAEPNLSEDSLARQTELLVQKTRELVELRDMYEKLITENGLRDHPESPAFQSLMDRYQRSVAMIENNYAQEGLVPPKAAPPVNSMADHYMGQQRFTEVKLYDPWMVHDSSVPICAQILVQSAERAGVLIPRADGKVIIRVDPLKKLYSGDAAKPEFWEKVLKIRNGASPVEAGVYRPTMSPLTREMAIRIFNTEQAVVMSVFEKRLGQMLPPDPAAKKTLIKFNLEKDAALTAGIRAGSPDVPRPASTPGAQNPSEVKGGRTGAVLAEALRRMEENEHRVQASEVPAQKVSEVKAGRSDAALAEAQRFMAENERRLQALQSQPEKPAGAGQVASGSPAGLYDEHNHLKPEYAGNEKILEALASGRSEAQILADIKSGRLGETPVVRPGIAEAPSPHPAGVKPLEPVRQREAPSVLPQKGAGELKPVEGFEHAEQAGSIEAVNRLKQLRFFVRKADGRLVEVNNVDAIDANRLGPREMAFTVDKFSGALTPQGSGNRLLPVEKNSILKNLRETKPWTSLTPAPSAEGTKLAAGSTELPPKAGAAGLTEGQLSSPTRNLPVPVAPESKAVIPYKPPETALTVVTPEKNTLVPAQPQPETPLVPAGSQKTAWQAATEMADIKIKNFEDAVRNNQGNKLQAALEVQADPLAVQRMNKYSSPAIRQAHLDATEGLKNDIRAQVKTEIAQKYNLYKPDGTLDTDRVVIEDMTSRKPGDAPKVGQDWDHVVKVRADNGRLLEVPVTESRPIVEQATFNSTVGRPGAPLANVPGVPRTPRGIAEHLGVTTTDHLHPEAFDNTAVTGERLARGDVPQQFNDAAQVSKAMQYKSDIARNKALGLQEGGAPAAQAQAWELEQMRQAAKMNDYIRGRTDAQGNYQPGYVDQKNLQLEAQGSTVRARIPEHVQKGMDILQQVREGNLSPAEARSQLAAMNETPDSIIQKNASLVEALDKLKPRGGAEAGTAATAIDEAFVQNVRDRFEMKQMKKPDVSTRINIDELIKPTDHAAASEAVVPGSDSRPGPPKSMLDGRQSSFAPEEPGLLTRGASKVGGAVTTARGALSDMEHNVNAAGEQLFNTLGGGSLPANASSARQALNLYGQKGMDLAGKGLAVYMAGEAAIDTYKIGQNIYQATWNPNLTDAEANKKFDEADQLARKMALGGSIGVTMSAVPLVGQAAGVGLGSYAGTRYLLENTDAGKAIDNAVLNKMDATIQTGERLSDTLQGLPSQTQRDTAQIKKIQEAYQNAIDRGDLLLKPGVTADQLMDDIAKNSSARGRSEMVAVYAPTDRQADKDFIDNLTKQMPGGGSGARILQNLATDLQFGTDEQKLAARATLADIRTKVAGGDYDVAGMVRTQPSKPYEPDPYGAMTHTLNNLYSDANSQEKDKIEDLFLKMSRGGPDAIKAEVEQLQQSINNRTGQSVGATGTRPGTPDAQTQKLADQMGADLLSQLLGITGEKPSGTAMEPPPDPNADRKNNLQNYLDRMLNGSDDTQMKMDEIQRQIRESHNSQEKKELQGQLATLALTRNDYDSRINETRNELQSLGVNMGPPPPKVQFDENGNPISADGYTANQLQNNNYLLQNQASGLGDDIAKLQAQIFASRNTPEKKDLMDQLQNKINQLAGMQNDLDANNKLLNALGQCGDESVYTKVPVTALAGMEPTAGGGDQGPTPQVSVLAGIMGNFSADRAAEMTAALANLGLQDKDVKANWVSYDAYNQIKGTLEAAGWEGNLTRAQAAQLVAQAQQAGSWGNIISSGLVDSIRQGAENFGQTMGGATANRFTEGTKGSATGTTTNRTESGRGTGDTQTSSTDDRSVAGSSSGGTGSGGGGSSGSSSGGTGGIVSTRTNPDGTITVRYSCGYVWTGKPPAPAKCPRCGRGLPTSTAVNTGGGTGGTGTGGSSSSGGIVSSQRNADGTITVRYSCGYRWTGKPPAPASCPRCGRGKPTSTTVNPSGSGTSGTQYTRPPNILPAR